MYAILWVWCALEENANVGKWAEFFCGNFVCEWAEWKFLGAEVITL